jgi:Ras homolog enriched in brain
MQQVKVRRIALLGARAVGKSSMAVKFTTKEFSKSYYPTIETTYSKQFKNYQIELIDTAGQDEYSIIGQQMCLG